MHNLIKTASAPLVYHSRVLTKLAGRTTRLAQNPTDWSRQVLDTLFSTHNFLNDKKVAIFWGEKDDRTGNAVGQVTVEDKISIPLFVENRILAPLDTFIKEGKPFRISPPRLKACLFDPELFGPIISRPEERSMTSDIPLHQQTRVDQLAEGRGRYASEIPKNVIDIRPWLEKIASQANEAYHGFNSILAPILAKVSRTDIEKFAHTLAADPQIYANFTMNGYRTSIDNILKIDPPTREKLAGDLLGNLPVNVIHFRMMPDRSFSMKVASDLTFAPHEVHLTPDRLSQVLTALGLSPSEVITKAASSTGFVHTIRTQDRAPLYLSDMKVPSEITSYGAYRVKEASGAEHTGWVFPLVYDFELGALDKQIFVSLPGDGVHAYQSKIAGVPFASEDHNTPSYPSDVPTSGDYGVFIFEAKDGNAVATAPIKIATVEHLPHGFEIHGTDMHGSPITLAHSDHSIEIIPMVNRPNGFVIPKNAKYASLKKPVSLLSTPDQLKTAAFNNFAGENYARIRSFANGRSFLFSGPLASKLDIEGVEQNPHEALFKLAVLGLSPASAHEVLTRTVHENEVTLGDLRDIHPIHHDLSYEKTAQHLQELAALPTLKQDTTKLASDIKDPEILDHVLALNFLNPGNIGILVDHMEDLEATVSRLSEILIACRLGAKKDIPEDAVVQARQALDEVIEGLANLKSRLGPQTESANASGGSGG